MHAGRVNKWFPFKSVAGKRCPHPRRMRNPQFYVSGKRPIRLVRRNGSLSLQWRHNGCDGVWNHQPYGCILNRLYRRRSKKTSKLRVTGLFAGNSPVTGEFPTQMASNAENGSIWWRHHMMTPPTFFTVTGFESYCMIPSAWTLWALNWIYPGGSVETSSWSRDQLTHTIVSGYCRDNSQHNVERLEWR